MKRPPPEPLKIGERVRLRGRPPVGVLLWVGDRLWSRVEWDGAVSGPRIVHLLELDRDLSLL